MNKKYLVPLGIFLGSFVLIRLVDYTYEQVFKPNVMLDKQYHAIIDGVYLNPDLVDEKPEMLIDKQKFLKELDQILPPKVIYAKFKGGYHEFCFELGISNAGKLGSIKMTADSDIPLSSTIGDYLGSQRFVQTLSEIKYKPAKLDGKYVASIMTITLIISLDQKGNVLFPWYMTVPSSSAGHIEFFDRSIRYNESDIYNNVEEMPEMIGGIDALSHKITYPALARRAGIEGKLIIAAVIDEKGDVIGFQIIKGLGVGIEEGVISALKKTKFRPGSVKGRPVKVKVVFPIVFKLDQSN